MIGFFHDFSWQVRRAFGGSALKIRGIPVRIYFRQMAPVVGTRSTCEIEVCNATDESIENIKCEVTAIELPSGLLAPDRSDAELSPRDSHAPRLRPGDKMRFILLHDVWLVEASGKTAISAKMTGTGELAQIFPADVARRIRIKIVADNVPPCERTYKIVFSGKLGRFNLLRTFWW